jgi:uncharacterized protein (DUF2235 family)
MGKNIVICCDGTGNEFGDNNSNVVKLYSTLIIDGCTQVGYYHPGVGTMGAPTATNWVSKQWTRACGLAFGAGLLPNVGDAYRYLMDAYEGGDKVFLFGFSRGAYTVRALAGLLHMCGLLYPGNEGLIPYILRLFSKRARILGRKVPNFGVAEGFKDTFSRPCPLHMVGVWDTVSSVGWIWDPLKLPYTAQNPDMLYGRHAVSIDERRCYFRSNLWGSQLEGQNIKQVWFAGVHSDVGGSYATPQTGLSQIALEWMLCEAASLDLRIDASRAKVVLGRVPPPPVEPPRVPPIPPIPPNPASPINVSLKGAWKILEYFPHSYYDPVAKEKRWRIPLGAPRIIPECSVLHASVPEKLKIDPSYRPPNLPQQYCIEPMQHCNFS